MEVDIHRYEERLQRFMEKLDELDEVNRDDILAFAKQLLAEGLSKGRIAKYLWILKRLAEMFGKGLRNATKEDMIDLVSKIEACSNWNENTKQECKITLRRFFKWLKNTDEYPPEVGWIRIARKKSNNRLPEEILTREEIERLADATDNPRDRALVLTLYESGCRIGELLPLKIKHVAFDEYGIALLVNGKTGSRRVRLIEYARDLASWLDIHPLKSSPESFVWITTGNKNKNELMRYSTVSSLLKVLSKKAGISKPVNPHSFRHARATHLASKLTEQQLKILFGWSASSRMASTYVHLSGKDIDEALLKLHGLKPEGNKELKSISIKACSRCNEGNSILSHFCKRCGFPLNARAIAEIDEGRRKIDEFIFEALKLVAESNPRLKKALIALLKEKGIEDFLRKARM